MHARWRRTLVSTFHHPKSPGTYIISLLKRDTRPILGDTLPKPLAVPHDEARRLLAVDFREAASGAFWLSMGDSVN